MAYMGNLASNFRDQGRFYEAEELQMQAMEARKRVPVQGLKHLDTLKRHGEPCIIIIIIIISPESGPVGQGLGATDADDRDKKEGGGGRASSSRHVEQHGEPLLMVERGA